MKKQPRANSTAIVRDLLSEISPEQQEQTRNFMALSIKIAEAIEAKGWSKMEFAQKIGKNASAVSRWLSGTHNFTLDTLLDIQRVLSVQLICLDDAKPVIKRLKLRPNLASKNELV